MQQQTKGVYNMKKDFENMAILTVFCIFAIIVTKALLVI